MFPQLIAGRLIALLSLVLLVLGPAMIGCAGRVSLASDPGAAPADFTIDLTVLSDEEFSRRIGAEFHPGRYVVLPDGTLHAHIGPVERRAGEIPALVRTLDHRQVNALWQLVQELGFTDPSQEDAAGNLDLIETQPNQVTYLASIVAEGTRLNYGRAVSATEATDLRFSRLTRVLAGLAWVSDEPPAESARRIPRRYDFGPDPYARYRQSTGGDES